MLTRLLESKAERKRSIWGAAMSTVVHTTVIGVAVFATAQARVEAPREPRQIVRWVNPPIERPSAAPRAPAPEVVAPRSLPVVDVPDRIDVVTPSVDLTPAVSAVSDAAPGGSVGVASPSEAPGSSGAAGAGEPFSADRVERQVYLRPGSQPPRYPNSLRQAGIEGQVIALFVVSVTGRVEPETVRFVQSDNALFEAAVRAALMNMRFVAAEVGGAKVRQLVQMPFVFTLTR